MSDGPCSAKGAAGSLRWAALTDIGKVREENEDAFAIEPKTGLFVVVDGMGGHRGGAVAAEIVARDLPARIDRVLQKLESRSPRAIRPMLTRLIREQNRDLHEQGIAAPEYTGMGATVALVLVGGRRLYAANAGDSRIYRLRDGRLKQLSVDHSVVAELLESGMITADQAAQHSMTGVVTQYMGMPEEVRPFVRSLTLRPGDRFLLCSDGLTDLLDDVRIAELLRSHTEPEAVCERLVAVANEAGAFDNVTAVIVDWRGRW